MIKTDKKSPGSRRKRPHIGIFWKCCKVYSRIYLNNKKTAYVGWCPKCARKIVARISPDGIDARFFRAT